MPSSVQLPVNLQSLQQLFSSTRVPYELITGEVMDDKMWSETHVSGGGGGGMMIGGYGASSTNSVRSVVKNKREIWIKGDDGVEHSFVFDADKVQIRTGHRLALLCSRVGDKITPMIIRNYTTDKTFNTPESKDMCLQRGMGKPIVAVHVLAGLGYFIALFNGPSDQTVLTFIALVALGFLYRPAVRREKAFKQEAQTYLQGLPRPATAAAA